MKTIWKRALAMLLVVVMVCGFAPIGVLAEIDWPTLPGKGITTWFNDCAVAIKSSAIRLGNQLRGFSLKVNAAENSGECGKAGNNLTWNLDTETGVLTISGTGEMANYYSVGSAPWFSINSSIRIVEINNGVTSIGYGAFYDCSNITNVIIPDSLTCISTEAFRNCTSLSTISIPDISLTIAAYAFLNTA